MAAPWHRFADKVLVIRKVLPDLEETVRSTREAMLSQVDLQYVQINQMLQEGLALVNDGLNALRASIPEQLLTYLTVPWRVISRDAFNSYLDEQTALPSRPLRAQPPAFLFLHRHPIVCILFAGKARPAVLHRHASRHPPLPPPPLPPDPPSFF
ncbi:hypothetical protein V8E54_003234 [Elaphomyces granulatus]